MDGETGFLVKDEWAMAAAASWLPGISPQDCRTWVQEHCDVDIVAGAYERIYRSVAHAHTAGVVASA